MTPAERREPVIIKASRRRRIAAGSGTTVADVNRLLRQFAEMQKLVRQLGGSASRLAGRPGSLPRLPGH
jgi:signal recognition particle subunit SRP54